MIWWFIFLPVVGEVTNSGAFDPTVIKILLLIGAILAAVLLIVAFFAGIAWSSDSLRQSANLWHFVEATFLLIVITIWAWLWDDRKSTLFTGGVPVFPVFPSPCNAACRDLVASQSLAFMEWKVILILSTVFLTIIIASVLRGWRMMITARAYARPKVGRNGTPVNGRTGKKGKNILLEESAMQMF